METGKREFCDKSTARSAIKTVHDMLQQAIKYGWTATALKSTIHKDNVIACGERANDKMISLRYTCDNSIFWLDYQRI